jgi:hypothetical protein
MGADRVISMFGKHIRVQASGLVRIGQGPFSVQTERFDTTADTISAVTLQGRPPLGWRYWRVYSVGTNDLVVQTGAADVSCSDTGDRDPDAYIDLTYYVFGAGNQATN